MGSILIEGYVKSPSECQNDIINNELGGVSKEELNALINKFNSLDSNSVDVDSVSGIQIKISNDEDNLLKITEDGIQAKLVSGTNIKTISGQSILGSGNLTTGYGLINQGTSNTTCTLNPNTFYMWGTVSALSLSFGSAISGIANEYTFQFTSSSSGTSLTLPSTVKWAKDEVIEIEANKIYQVSIVNNLATYLMWS